MPGGGGFADVGMTLGATGVTVCAVEPGPQVNVTMPPCLSRNVAGDVGMILGKGRVLFISNLIYNRFSEIANYPSGAAISIVLFVLAMLIVYGLTHQVNKRWQS